MVAVLAVTETISYAALFYAFAVIVTPMRDELGASTAQVSGALSVSLAVAGLAAPLVGRWVDRRGARALMTLGSALAGVSVLAWSQVRTVPQLYAAFVGVGLAGAMVLYEPAFAVVNTWFRRRRAQALLLVTVVAGFSSTIFLPVTQTMVDGVGWRGALVVLAALAGLCAIPHAVVLRRSPRDLGLVPDGADGDQPRGRTSESREDDLPTEARSPAVRWLTVAAVGHAIAVTVVAVHLVAYLRDAGLAPGVAATAAGALGLMSVTGRLAFTGAAARLGLARVAALMLAAQAGGVALLLSVPHPAGLVTFVLLFGAGFGVMTIARAALLGDLVPLGAFAAASGRQALAATIGRVAAPAVAGVVITSTGFTPVLIGVAACCLIAAGALLLVGSVNR
ncbi:MFS transporter [Actinotalea ferrariae]|uniref:MFS transporter n=1 Tax=Actinotalea ferrariae TaxID=1386098 RepID=UPI001C8BBDDF|nr:MFS transporter [Actinotalea ferrariae]MBX9243827.1 MFS transporter [Actinotalea ferrariae]